MIAGYYWFFIGQRRTTERKAQLVFSIRIPRFVYRRRSVFISQIQVDEPPKEHHTVCVYLINDVGIFGKQLSVSAVFWKKFHIDENCVFPNETAREKIVGKRHGPKSVFTFLYSVFVLQKANAIVVSYTYNWFVGISFTFYMPNKTKDTYIRESGRYWRTFFLINNSVKTNCNKNIFSTAVSGKKFSRNKASRKYNVYLCVKISLVKLNARIIKFFFTKSLERFLNRNIHLRSKRPNLSKIRLFGFMCRVNIIFIFILAFRRFQMSYSGMYCRIRFYNSGFKRSNSMTIYLKK